MEAQNPNTRVWLHVVIRALSHKSHVNRDKELSLPLSLCRPAAGMVPMAGSLQMSVRVTWDEASETNALSDRWSREQGQAVLRSMITDKGWKVGGHHKWQAPWEGMAQPGNPRHLATLSHRAPSQCLECASLGTSALLPRVLFIP